MAKLKNSFKQTGMTKLPSPNSGSPARISSPKIVSLRDSSSKVESSSSAGSVVQALGFGSLHTKATGSSSSPQWTGLLSAVTSGGSSGLLSGGLLGGGTLGLIGKLLNLFGGGKSTPPAPTPFVMPPPQRVSLSVGTPGQVSSVSLGIQSNLSITSQGSPVYPQISSAGHDHASQSAQVVQIVKQALLTSSSLNDVISEI